MALQQVLDVVRRHHLFWDKELCRARDEDLKDCEFFRQQCEDEVALLEADLGLPFTHRARNDAARKSAERGLSNARPATTRIGGRAMVTNANQRRTPTRT